MQEKLVQGINANRYPLEVHARRLCQSHLVYTRNTAYQALKDADSNDLFARQFSLSKNLMKRENL